MKQNKIDKWALFLIGVFSMTQINIIGWIGISELVLFLLAPVFIVQDWSLLKRHGFSTVIWLTVLMFFGGLVANGLNAIPFRDAVRGLAAVYAIFSIIVCLHHFMWRNIDNMKWLLLGIAISGVICTFVFQPGVDRTMNTGGEVLSGAEAMQNRMAYSLFWFAQLCTWVLLPIQTLYLLTPIAYVVVVFSLLMLNAMMSAGSRSGFGLLFISLVLLIIGGRRQRSMMRVRQHLLLMCVCGLFLVSGITSVYKFVALHGCMGNEQYEKYIKQSARGNDLLSLLMGGRTAFFAAFYAALDKPIIGHGSWALDYKGYYQDFLVRYGTAEEVEAYQNSTFGRGERVGLLPGHSQIMGGWTWYGIFGLFFWLYVILLYFNTLRCNLAVVPQWYGYLCLTIPSAIWGVLFSPFGSRIPTVLVFIMCLFVKAICEKRMLLPEKMCREILEKAR